jgi:hypothetical protein
LYVRNEIGNFDIKQASRMLDLFKFISGFASLETKKMLEHRLEVLK